MHGAIVRAANPRQRERWPGAPAEGSAPAFLVAAVIGSGIAAQRLSPDDIGLQLLDSRSSPAPRWSR